LFGFQDVRRALVARKQVRPVFCFKEGGQRLDPFDDQDEVILAQGEDRVDKVMARALRLMNVAPDNLPPPAELQTAEAAKGKGGRI
ncbi:MAG: hypothetical protein CMK98_13500, partial [Pseudomonas sp.]|nr:hypothetical protein [Pseudomonas sp.]